MTIPQSSIEAYQGPALEGQVFGDSDEPEQYVNNRAPVVQVSTGTIVDNAAGTYTSLINGITVTTARDTDAPTSRLAHVAAINANAFLAPLVLSESGAGGVYTVTSKEAGVPFTHTGSATGGTNANNIVATTANADYEWMTPGLGCVLDTLSTDEPIKKARKPSASGDLFAGIVCLAFVGHDESGDYPDNIYEHDTVFPVLKKGKIWVKTEQAVTPADTVFMRYAAGAGGTRLGGFRKDADTATAVTLAGKAVFMTAADAGGMVQLSISVL